MTSDMLPLTPPNENAESVPDANPAALRRVLVLGIGGGAGRVVARFAHRFSGEWLTLACADTDSEDLERLHGVQTLLLGAELLKGRGCGNDPRQGERAAGAATKALQDLIGDVDLLLVLACLGRGTASGAAQLVARLAREMGVLSLFFVTTPFAVEGNSRGELAATALTELRRHTDVVVVLPNDLLFTCFPASTVLTEAFHLADGIVAESLFGMTELVRCRGVIPIDFASLSSLLHGQEAVCSIGVAQADGEGRTEAVLDALFQSPMLGGQEMVDRADAAIAVLTGRSLSIGEMNQILQALQGRLPAAAERFIGVSDHVPHRGDVQLVLLTIRYQSHRRAVGSSMEKDSDGGRRKQRRQPGRAKGERQISLPFVDEGTSLGIFSKAAPTLHQDENLDIPTYLRRNITLDLEA